jgi:hypothetical protein
MTQATCANCGRGNVSNDIPVRIAPGGGGGLRDVHIEYLNGKSWLSSYKRAMIFADVCNDCGHLRLYVKERNKIWKNALGHILIKGIHKPSEQ